MSDSNYSFSQYSEDIEITRKGSHVSPIYLMLGLIGELGELVDAYALHGRGGCFWYDESLTDDENQAIESLYCFVRMAKKIELFKKEVRKSGEKLDCKIDILDEQVDDIQKEFGGVLWYLTTLIIQTGFTVEQIALVNKSQLLRRFDDNPDWMVNGNKSH